MDKEKLVILTGAGISAESGISTFRDSGGLWEGFDVMDVASIEGWRRDPERVLEFYNSRRRHLKTAKPNEGHKALVELEVKYDVTIITQNVDDLHERAGSKKVIHLHGQLTKARPVDTYEQIWDIGYSDIHIGDCDEKGRQLRPDIVWFGEMVPMMEVAALEVATCNKLIIIGTSLVVYPAAGLVELAPEKASVYLIDPMVPEYRFFSEINHIQETAAGGTPRLVKELLKEPS